MGNNINKADEAMNILITGGSGFVGKALSYYLLGQGHVVTAIGRSSVHEWSGCENFHYISADTTQKGTWQDRLQEVDAVVNLAGATIFRRWTERYKAQLYDSRILTTRHLVAALPENRDVTLCSASAAGYYGSRGDELLNEAARPGDDFLAKVCIAWENEACQAEAKGIRVVVMRFGVVLGKGGGAIEKMLLAFRLCAGGPLGNGKHWFPWIHMTDLIAAICFLLENAAVQGPVNFCAPGQVRNADFARALGNAVNRPAFMPAPAFMIHLIMGELGRSLLNSQRSVPEKLTGYGFEFQYPDIDNALREIVK